MQQIIGYVILALIVAGFLIAAWWALTAIGQVYDLWAAKKQGEAAVITARKNGEAILAQAENTGQANIISATRRGEADLAQAKNEQQIQVARAEGRLKAAELDKQAEIIDAEAVAKSVEIIGRSLHENHGYLQWKWIHMMENSDNATIYIPTEAGLPILEAGKRPNKGI